MGMIPLPPDPAAPQALQQRLLGAAPGGSGLRERVRGRGIARACESDAGLAVAMETAGSEAAGAAVTPSAPQ